MNTRPFHPGFRISAFDAIVLVVGGGACGYAVTIDRWFGIAIAFAILHFFLFCNVLRLSRPLELIWAAIFAGMAVATIATGLLKWPWVFALSLVATVVVAVIEIRRPSYHGVGWSWVNPGLPEWWQTSDRCDGSR